MVMGRTPSPHRFLGFSSSSSSSYSSSAAPLGGDELNEDEILWTNYGFPEQNNPSRSRPAAPIASDQNRGTSFPRNSGILAALPGSGDNSVLCRKTSLPTTSSSSSRPIPRRPLQGEKRDRLWFSSQSAPGKKLMNQSAPMNVPVMSIAMAQERSRRLKEEFQEDDGDGEEEMLPPHEIVARATKSTCSVLEGVGRTLKGRDLRQVRNAVWRQTGFLD